MTKNVGLSRETKWDNVANILIKKKNNSYRTSHTLCTNLISQILSYAAFQYCNTEKVFRANSTDKISISIVNR